jgi:hypothetical protein
MNRLRATLGFIFSGGLLVFLSPYLIHEAVNQTPSVVRPDDRDSDLCSAVMRSLQTVLAAYHRKGRDNYSGEGRTQQTSVRPDAVNQRQLT